MFSTIVVGTDGSQTARRAVRVAADIARHFDARLHVVYAYRDLSIADHGIGPAAAGAMRWQEASEGVLTEALADPALVGLQAEGHSVAGTPPEAIVTVAERTGAELIVVGNRGMQGTQRPQDSVPDAVAHRAPCHVLIAKTT